jgi:hypothetical protein
VAVGTIVADQGASSYRDRVPSVSNCVEGRGRRCSEGGTKAVPRSVEGTPKFGLLCDSLHGPVIGVAIGLLALGFTRDPLARFALALNPTG